MMRLGKRKLMIRALVVFLTTTLLAITVNSLLGHGFHLEYSISRYVGLEAWSAIVFALGNVVVAVSILYYLYNMGETWGMNRWFYWVVITMLIALIGLSMCPIGYFDPVGGNFGVSIISKLHEIFSRLMFASMMMVVAATLFSEKVARVTKYAGVAFILYGLLCALGFLLKAVWFWKPMLVFEGMYILGFMVWCLEGRTRSKSKEMNNAKEV